LGSEVLRQRAVAGPSVQTWPPDPPGAAHDALLPPDRPGAAHDALVALEAGRVWAALRDLPEPQREAIVLRYYADLSEGEISAAMRISRSAVKNHTALGMSALRAALDQATSWPADPADSGEAGSGREP
jgi:DNA-directed RNA polymerase specialized sigma24 family protein